MLPLKNLAGHDASIFLFRFDLTGNGISFVLNEAIAADMYDDLDEQLKPLAHACCETLLRYKPFSADPTIMDGHILVTGEFEVMLSRGLGKYVPETEKQPLFADANRIAELLITVMDRRTEEEKARKPSGPARKPAPPDPLQLKHGLAQLGKAKSRQAKRQWAAEGRRIRPGLRQLQPEDLPPGVTAVGSYDDRGDCLTFAHATLGELGKIVLIKIPDGQMLIHAELCQGPEEKADRALAQRKRQVFEQAVAIINQCFEDNFPE